MSKQNLKVHGTQQHVGEDTDRVEMELGCTSSFLYIPFTLLWGETGGLKLLPPPYLLLLFPPPSVGVPASLIYFYSDMLHNTAKFFLHFSQFPPLWESHFLPSLLPPPVPLPPPISQGPTPCPPPLYFWFISLCGRCSDLTHWTLV